MTDQTPAEPLSAEEEARWRAYIDAACREVDVVRGGLFDMSARLFATLDAERAAHNTSLIAVVPDAIKRAGGTP